MYAQYSQPTKHTEEISIFGILPTINPTPAFKSVSYCSNFQQSMRRHDNIYLRKYLTYLHKSHIHVMVPHISHLLHICTISIFKEAMPLHISPTFNLTFIHQPNHPTILSSNPLPFPIFMPILAEPFPRFLHQNHLHLNAGEREKTPHVQWRPPRIPSHPNPHHTSLPSAQPNPSRSSKVTYFQVPLWYLRRIAERSPSFTWRKRMM